MSERTASITEFVDDLLEKVAAECNEAEVAEKLAEAGGTDAGKALRKLALECRQRHEQGETLDTEKQAADAPQPSEEGTVKLSHVRDFYNALKAGGSAS